LLAIAVTIEHRTKSASFGSLDELAKCDQMRQDRAEGTGAVAEDLLDRGAELAEGSVVFNDFEARAVTETVGAGQLEADAAAADVFCRGSNRAGRVGDGGSNEECSVLKGWRLYDLPDEEREAQAKKIPAGADDIAIRVPQPAFKWPKPASH
jgi:hypothetical protein